MPAHSLYIHIPFCRRKCPYCDFYSLTGKGREEIDRYLKEVERDLAYYKESGEIAALDTLYLGGGTPVLAGEKALCSLLEGIEREIGFREGAEITLEANPNSTFPPLLRALRRAGYNRISFGVQSVCDRELRALGRLHDAQQAKLAIKEAREAGFDNLSVDLMLGIPYQTSETVGEFLRWCMEENIPHLSAYMLSIEEGTPFAESSLPFADEDETAGFYELVSQQLIKVGYEHYEVSNFAKPGYRSRHNLVYWRDEYYLGLGPGAHSFTERGRFGYPRDLAGYLEMVRRGKRRYIECERGGGAEEVLMLALRLSDGIELGEFAKRFSLGEKTVAGLLEKSRLFARQGWMEVKDRKIRLTSKGFLLLNSILSDLLLLLPTA